MSKQKLKIKYILKKLIVHFPIPKSYLDAQDIVITQSEKGLTFFNWVNVIVFHAFKCQTCYHWHSLPHSTWKPLTQLPFGGHLLIHHLCNVDKIASTYHIFKFDM